CCLLAVLGLTAWALTARAEHAYIELRVMRLDADSGLSREEARAAVDTEPPAGGVHPRPLFKVKAGEPLVLQFIYTNAYPHGDTKNVRIRYFLARAEKVGQKTLPPLGDNVVTRGQFEMNFKPKCRVGARVAFTVREPGVYLLRVDSFNTNSDHEHFAAIDVQPEKRGGQGGGSPPGARVRPGRARAAAGQATPARNPAAVPGRLPGPERARGRHPRGPLPERRGHGARLPGAAGHQGSAPGRPPHP